MEKWNRGIHGMGVSLFAHHYESHWFRFTETDPEVDLYLSMYDSRTQLVDGQSNLDISYPYTCIIFRTQNGELCAILVRYNNGCLKSRPMKTNATQAKPPTKTPFNKM
jgi:hypothetical protein